MKPVCHLFFFSGDFCAAGEALAFLLASTDTEAAGDGSTTDAAGDACGELDGDGTASDVNTECEPFIPGSDSSKASNMKATAAPIVIRARIFCVPRGPKAVLETLLVKSAPASALPGCKRTTTMRTAQAKMNSP